MQAWADLAAALLDELAHVLADGPGVCRERRFGSTKADITRNSQGERRRPHGHGHWALQLT
eukprot:5709358-Prymnesium_polylepis.1